jgi:glutamate---cysteine ligase / carboxylate-amine ligase
LIETKPTFLRPALEAQGDWIEVADLVRETLDHGNSAQRQLWAFARAGRFEDVVDLILWETVLGF